MMIKHPIRKETELYWRNIQRIEAVTAVKQGKRTWKKLRIYTKEGYTKLVLHTLPMEKTILWRKF